MKILFCKATFHCCYQYIEGKVWKWCIIGDDMYHHAMPYTYISTTQWAKFISEGAFLFIFQDNSWSTDILPSQGCWSRGCRECHGTPKFWQISLPYLSRGGTLSELCPANYYLPPWISRPSYRLASQLVIKKCPLEYT